MPKPEWHQSFKIEKIGIENVKGIYATRNFVAHDYDGVDLGFVETGIREFVVHNGVSQPRLFFLPKTTRAIRIPMMTTALTN